MLEKKDVSPAERFAVRKDWTDDGCEFFSIDRGFPKKSAESFWVVRIK